jgi:hypothetical protein
VTSLRKKKTSENTALEMAGYLNTEINISIQYKLLIFVCSSYVDIRSRANTTMGLDFGHMIKARTHREG